MRTKDILLNDFDEAKILYQYLYMSPSHKIRINNGLCDLDISMTDNFGFRAVNLNFPDNPPLDYTEIMTLAQTLGIIEYLKSQPAVEYVGSFKSRWDEIKTITETNVGLNKFYDKNNNRTHGQKKV